MCMHALYLTLKAKEEDEIKAIKERLDRAKATPRAQPDPVYITLHYISYIHTYMFRFS